MAAGTLVTVQEVGLFGGDEISYAAVDATDGNRVPADVDAIIVKVGATATVITMDSAADINEREGDIASSSVSDTDVIFMPSRPPIFRLKTGDNAGYVLVTYSQGTNVEIAALKWRK